MQVSPDKNVRVTETSPIGRIPVSPENASGLKNGDFLVATVEQVQGDMLLLRVDGGFLLNAALQGNVSLFEGDVIEASVSKDGGTCLLYILNVLHTGAQATRDTGVSVTPQTLSAMLSVIKRNPGLDADIALFLAENNIPDTPENIAALTQMSRGTGIGALLGRILGLVAQQSETAQTGTSQAPVMPTGDAALLPQGKTVNTVGTPGNGESQPVPGGQAQSPAPANGTESRTGIQVPAQAQAPGLPTAAEGPETSPGAPAAPHTDSQQGTAAPAPDPGMAPDALEGKPGPTPGARTGVLPAAQGAGSSGSPESETGPLPVSDGTVQPYAENAPSNTEAAPKMVNRDIQYTVQNTETMARGEVSRDTHGEIFSRLINPGDTAVHAGGVDPGTKQGPDEHIGGLIRGLLFQPESETGEDIKRVADGMSRGLKTLKSELIQTDIKYREPCLKNVDQALRQMELAGRAAHFEHMQIPFAVKEGEHRTAELYVFRRKGGRKRAAEAGLSILVALDTDHMGRVETLIREEGGSISLEFRLEQTDMTETFKQHSEPLQKAVETAGYSLTGIRFAGLEKKTTVLNAGGMVSLDAGEASHGIDVQI